MMAHGPGHRNSSDKPLPPTPLPVESAVVVDAYFTLFNAQQEVACLMLASMTSDILKNLEDYNAYDMLQELKTMIQQQADQELFEIVKAFHSCKQEKWQFVGSYVLKMKGYLDRLERLGFLMPNELGVT
ncbi:hypothetical protein Tco_0625446 [Tanacetum coccineum]|uniref:Uncharacterized protein n=1 Tax=Tanacetum coccineum TaxID=301880 RepID=A0ABQ4WGT9_9ASTR